MSSFRRRPATPGDAAAVAELVAAMDVAVQGSTDYALADLGDEWRELDLARDARVVVDDGEWIVGYGTVDGLHLPRRGRASRLLNVDSESLTGATRPYESVGMQVTREIDAFERTLE